MQMGKHYAIKIRGQEYYTVCVGMDDKACYLKDISGNLLVVPFSDDLAFSTVGETLKYNDELDKICNDEIDKEFEAILEEAYAAKKLISPDIPLSAIDAYTRQAAINQTLNYLHSLNNSLQKVEDLVQAQAIDSEQPPALTF